MLMLSVFATLCEPYLGIWPNMELFGRIFFFKTQTLDMVAMRSCFLLRLSVR
jgi:hypothetical protein